MGRMPCVYYMSGTVWSASQTDHPDVMKNKRSLAEIECYITLLCDVLKFSDASLLPVIFPFQVFVYIQVQKFLSVLQPLLPENNFAFLLIISRKKR